MTTQPTGLADFGLTLAAVRVEGFRLLRDVSLALKPSTTVLLGENNSGKTSFLEALAVAFGQRQPQKEDIFSGPDGVATCFQIDLRIQPAEKQFNQGVIDTVGNAIQLEAQPYFAIRTHGELSAEGWGISLRRTFLRGWATDSEAAALVDELASPGVTRSTLELLQFDLLDARRDIKEQLRNRRTFWGKTMENVELEAATQASIEGKLAQLGTELIENSGVLKRVKEDLSELSAALSTGGLSVELEPLPTNIDDLIRAVDVVVSSPRSTAFPVSSQGMGTRSIAALLVFRSFVNIVRARKDPEKTLSLAGFEEPEAHLHPQAQRAVFKILAGVGGQRVISTHSKEVAAMADLDAYRVFRRDGAESRISQLVAAQVQGFSDFEKSRRYIQEENPEILFAKAVGIVEGETEAALIPELARHWWPVHGSDAVGISIVNTRGAGSAQHIIPVLEALKIPWTILADGDAAGDKGLKSVGKAIGRPLSRADDGVVQLPPGQAIERHLAVSCDFRTILATAARLQHGPLSKYRNRDGEKGKGGVPRNYTAHGWQLRLTEDLLAHDKVATGRTLGEELANRVTPSAYPTALRSFFQSLDRQRAEE